MYSVVKHGLEIASFPSFEKALRFIEMGTMSDAFIKNANGELWDSNGIYLGFLEFVIGL